MRVKRGDLERVLIGGLERREIVIAEPDPEWPRRFQAERARIERALGPVPIEHIGSTAVPGLAAKPIVDILVAVADPDAEGTYLPALELAGYVLRVREPGHRMLRTPQLDVHVHVWADGSPEARRDLVFRDRLREDAAARAAYERLKRELAAREWEDMNFYAEAKGQLIAAITAGRPA